MAQALRNVAIQKHNLSLSLLKNMNTRSVVTVVNRNQIPAPVSAATKRKTLREILRATFGHTSSKIQEASQDMSKEYDEYDWPRFRPIVRSASCPDIGGIETSMVKRRPRSIHGDWLKARSVTNFSKHQTKQRRWCHCAANATAPKATMESPVAEPNMFENLAATMCPCPCPCSCGPCCSPCAPPCGPCTGGGQLPPPCNTPPKCLQYMTGYYYYPYGTWFCGPYHVSTGCTPCCGPVCAGTPCGMGPCNPQAVRCCCKPGCCCGVLDCGFGQNKSCGSSEPFPKGVHATDFPKSQDSAKVPCPAVLFGLPYDGVQTPTPCGTGYNVNFPPIALSTNTGHDFSQNNPSSGTSNPRWLTQHTPCECNDCQLKRTENATQADKQTKVDLKAVYNILGPFSKAFPSKKTEKITQIRKSSEYKPASKKASDILKDPKVKAMFP